LQGPITAPSQAAVPKASVVIKNTDTGIERGMLSDEEGHYLFPYAAPGNYSLTVEAPGFKTTVRNGVVLSINDNLRLDLQLPLGQAAEKVQVSGEMTAVRSEERRVGKE